MDLDKFINLFGFYYVGISFSVHKQSKFDTCWFKFKTLDGRAKYAVSPCPSLKKTIYFLLTIHPIVYERPKSREGHVYPHDLWVQNDVYEFRSVYICYIRFPFVFSIILVTIYNFSKTWYQIKYYWSCYGLKYH